MDPITAALRVVEMVLEIHKLNIESLSGEDRIAYGKMVLADIQRWHDFLDFFRPKS